MSSSTMTTVDVNIICIYNPEPADNRAFNISIPGPAPITPQRVRKALAGTLSSPIQNYDCETKDGTTFHISHQMSNRERLKEKSEALKGMKGMQDQIEGLIRREAENRKQIKSLEDLEATNRKQIKSLEDLEATNRKEINSLKGREAAREAILMKWETADRLSQALNDYAFGLLEKSVVSIIQNSTIRYLPLLFSVWYFKWKSNWPLPDVLSNLTTESEERYQSLIPRITEDLETALEDASMTIPQAAIQLMMACFNMRDRDSRKNETHPTLTVQFASTLFREVSAPLPPSLRTLASQLVVHASAKPVSNGPVPNYVFDDTDKERGAESNWPLLLGPDGDEGYSVDEPAVSETRVTRQWQEEGEQDKYGRTPKRQRMQ